jgi:hypothetical protein
MNQPTQPAAAGPSPGIPAFVLALIVLGTMTLVLFRTGLWLHYRPDGSPAGAELVRAFWMGLRFDLKWLATLAFPVLLAAWAVPPRWRRKALGAYAVILYLSLNWLAAVNHFYFGYFGGPIDPMIFGAIEDDTQIVVHTIVHDFPIVRILAAWLAVSLFEAWLTLRLAARLPDVPAGRPRLAYAAAVLLCALLARGSVGTFPLGTKHMSVSSDGFRPTSRSRTASSPASAPTRTPACAASASSRRSRPRRRWACRRPPTRMR